MSGVNNEVVSGGISTLSIAGSVFNLKRLWNLTKDHAVIRDANSSGPNYTFGRNNHGLSFTIEASTPDLPTIDAWTDEDSNGDLSNLTIIISLPPIGGGSTVTATFNAKLNHMEFGHPSEEGKVLIRIDGIITSATITWG